MGLFGKKRYNRFDDIPTNELPKTIQGYKERFERLRKEMMEELDCIVEEVHMNSYGTRFEVK